MGFWGLVLVLRFLQFPSWRDVGEREDCIVGGYNNWGSVIDGWIGVSLTASLISSLCSSVSLFSGFASCAGPWDWAFVAGAGADCCICFWPSGPLNSPWLAFPRPRCRENDEALKGMAFVLMERSGSFVPA